MEFSTGGGGGGGVSYPPPQRILKDLLRYPLAKEGVYAPSGNDCLAHAMQKVSYIVGLTALRLAFLTGYGKTKWCNGFYTEFRQSFAKETLSYNEMLKS